MQRSLFPVFISAALVIAGYAALVQFLPFKVQKGQNQFDTNMLRAQDYLGRPEADTVMAGSSLTFRLPPPVLGPHIANLAIAGGSPATGITLIERSGARPRLVLVEVNLLSRGTDAATLQSLLRFPERQLRESVRAFRTGYDPVNLAERVIQALLHKADEDLVPQPDAIRKLIADQRQAMSSPPDAVSLNRNLAQIASLVSTLQARGVRVGFFELPIDPNLMDLAGEKELRRAVMERFPPDHFCWLKLSVPGGAHTIDGLHLMTADAVLVATQVVEQRRACLKS
ncbi:MAG TPA: hypothetical protein VFI23_17875 [Rhizomicrobium sp.]|nr:hypothetical protein [Rhizomicrobium sp.]